MIPDQFTSAVCASTDPEAWFPEIGITSANRAAQRMCGVCPHVTACLDYALTVRVVGIWGGTTDSDRQVIRRARGITATPLHLTYHQPAERTSAA